VSGLHTLELGTLFNVLGGYMWAQPPFLAFSEHLPPNNLNGRQVLACGTACVQARQAGYMQTPRKTEPMIVGVESEPSDHRG